MINDMILDSEAMTEKGKQPISYTVTNNSEETLKSFELKVSNDDGTILQKEYLVIFFLESPHFLKIHLRLIICLRLRTLPFRQLPMDRPIPLIRS